MRQPGAAPPAGPHCHTAEGTCWGALRWQRARSGLPTASDTARGFPGLGCLPRHAAGRVTGQRPLPPGHGLGDAAPICSILATPSPDTVPGPHGDARASLLPQAPSTPHWYPPPCHGGRDPAPKAPRVLKLGLQPWPLLQLYRGCHIPSGPTALSPRGARVGAGGRGAEAGPRCREQPLCWCGDAGAGLRSHLFPPPHAAAPDGCGVEQTQPQPQGKA